MVIDSMLSGEIIERGLAIPEMPSLVKGTPSRTISGSFDALSEAPPRIRIVAPPSGEPPELVTTTPGEAPVRRSWADVEIPASTSSGITMAIEPVASDFLTVP